MVTTHSEEEWRLLRSLRNQGRGDSGGWLEHVRLGFNYRLDDVHSALGIGQLEKLDEILQLRGEVAARYGELLDGIDGVGLPCADDAGHVRSWFVYVVALPDNVASRRVAEKIGDIDGEGTLPATCRRSTFSPTCASATGSATALSGRRGHSSRTLALPFFTALERDAQERVAEALAAAL
jgi:perosamine synthetase